MVTSEALPCSDSTHTPRNKNYRILSYILSLFIFTIIFVILLASRSLALASLSSVAVAKLGPATAFSIGIGNAFVVEEANSAIGVLRWTHRIDSKPDFDGMSEVPSFLQLAMAEGGARGKGMSMANRGGGTGTDRGNHAEMRFFAGVRRNTADGEEYSELEYFGGGPERNPSGDDTSVVEKERPPDGSPPGCHEATKETPIESDICSSCAGAVRLSCTYKLAGTFGSSVVGEGKELCSSFFGLP